MVVALPDALRLGEDGLRAGAGQRGGVVGAGGNAGAQIAPEQGGREARLAAVADRREGAGCYGFLQESGRGGGRPRRGAGAARVFYGVRRAGAEREGELAGTGCCGAERAARAQRRCTACW